MDWTGISSDYDAVTAVALLFPNPAVSVVDLPVNSQRNVDTSPCNRPKRQFLFQSYADGQSDVPYAWFVRTIKPAPDHIVNMDSIFIE